MKEDSKIGCLKGREGGGKPLSGRKGRASCPWFLIVLRVRRDKPKIQRPALVRPRGLVPSALGRPGL